MASPLENGLFQGFRALDVATENVRFRGVIGGAVPPLLLLCGSAWKKDPVSGVIGVEKGPLIPVVCGFRGDRAHHSEEFPPGIPS